MLPLLISLIFVLLLGFVGIGAFAPDAVFVCDACLSLAFQLFNVLLVVSWLLQQCGEGAHAELVSAGLGTHPLILCVMVPQGLQLQHLLGLLHLVELVESALFLLVALRELLRLQSVQIPGRLACEVCILEVLPGGAPLLLPAGLLLIHMVDVP